MNDNDIMPYDLPTEVRKIIKVIGVGGGGSNAVKNMFKQGVHNVSFAICNVFCWVIVFRVPFAWFWW